MKRFRVVRYLCAAAFLMALGAPTAAFAADECATDADCADGFSCETSETPCAAVDCAVDPDGSGDAGCVNECESTTVSQCEPEPPASCATAADCTGDEVCVTVTYEECSGSDAIATCAPGEDCDAGAQADTEFSCTTQTEGYCLPPYMAPCEKSSDCGQGFECVESEMCECSGGGSTGSGSTGGGSVSPGGLTTDVGGSDCTCSGTGDYYCELDEVECASDSDCAGDFVCDELYGHGGGDTTVCVSSPDGGSECEVDAGSSNDTTQYCQPADLERWVGAAGHVYGGTAQDEASGGSSGGSNGDGRDVVSSEVDRGNGATSGGGGGQGSESAGCASTGLVGSTGRSAGGALGFMLMVAFGVVGVRRRRNR